MLKHARETVHEASFEFDKNRFNHISIEYVENKLCFWINGHQMNAMYRTQAFVSLVQIDVEVENLGILMSESQRSFSISLTNTSKILKNMLF